MSVVVRGHVFAAAITTTLEFSNALNRKLATRYLHVRIIPTKAEVLYN